MMKFKLKPNYSIALSAFLLMTTPALQAVKRPSSPKVPEIVTPLPQSIQAQVMVVLSKLHRYTEKTYIKTVEFFDKNSGKGFDQDLEDYKELHNEILGIYKEIIPVGNPILGSLKSLAQKMEDAQSQWIRAIALKTIEALEKQADPIALKYELMADNIFGSANAATKKRENGIKQLLEAAGAEAELELLKKIVNNIDNVFNFDSKPLGLNNDIAKAYYLREHKDFSWGGRLTLVKDGAGKLLRNKNKKFTLESFWK